MLRRAFLVLEPDTNHVLARPPLRVLGVAKPDNRPALRTDEILGRTATPARTLLERFRLEYERVA